MKYQTIISEQDPRATQMEHKGIYRFIYVKIFPF